MKKNKTVEFGLSPVDRYELLYKKFQRLRLKAEEKYNPITIAELRELSTKLGNINGLFYQIDKRLDNISKRMYEIEQELEN